MSNIHWGAEWKSKELTVVHPKDSSGERKHLQPWFDTWKNKPAFAGAPYWLRECQSDDTISVKKPHQAFGYSFTPDIHWRRTHSNGSVSEYVIELKSAIKYEPLALVEVLHHAYMLRILDPETKAKPVIVSHFNAWLRAAVASCSGNPNAPELLEFDELRDDSENSILWLDNPYAKWDKLQDREKSPGELHPPFHQSAALTSGSATNMPMPTRGSLSKESFRHFRLIQDIRSSPRSI